MGEQKSYTKRQVDRSFRKFNDLVEDLFSSPWQLWGDRLSHLMNHCEQDSVMRVVTEPLRTNKNVDVSSWYEEASKTNTGMTGSAYYELPINDDDKTSLLYQFMLLASLNRIDVTDFGESFFGAESPQEAVGQFNDQIVRLCTCEVCYRLDEIREDTAGQTEIQTEALVVFHHHDNSVNIRGNIKGSNVAIGASTVSDSSAEYKNNEDVATVLKALKPLIKDVVESQRRNR